MSGQGAAGAPGAATHSARISRKLSRSLRARAGALVLGCLAAIALFAELIAADAPILAVGNSGVQLLPAVTRAADYASLSPAEIDARHAGDLALWPIVRQGPGRRDAPLLGPSRAHPLGTDARGRDLVCELCYGARAALGPTLVALVLSLLLGAALGGLSGYLGGGWDELLSRSIEAVQALPTAVVVTLAMAAAPARSGYALALAVFAVRWAEIARVARAETMRLRAQDHVAGARALGAGPLWILRRHILPHAARSVVICAVNAVPALVLIEAAVAFLGVGVPSSWGSLLAEGLAPGGARFGAICAGTLLVITTAAAQLVAEAAAEALDARVPAQ